MQLYAQPNDRHRAVEQLESRLLFADSAWDVALIDRTLPAYSVLERAMSPGGHVILYDGRHESAPDVLGRVAQWAEESGCEIGSLSLLAHASPGRFALGNEWISNTSIDEIAEDLTRLGQCMSTGATINLFGCNLIDGLGGGKELIERVAQFASARVFASNDITGRGGDWVLEAASRKSAVDQSDQPRSPFSQKAIEQWPGQLPAAGITVTPTSGLVTTESGGTASFTVKLDSNPGGGNSVSIGLTSGDLTEGTVSTATVTFTNGNWNTPQTVTITGVDDLLVDGNIAYSIVTAPAVSTNVNYNGLNASDVSVTNVDNDTPGITVTPTSGLATTEAGGTDSFTVRLNSAPSANVTIPISSSNTAEGTVSTSNLTFTTGNWNTPQTITVTGVDDSVDDGDTSYTIVTGSATSSDSNYNGLNASDVSATNTDDDTAGITVSPTSGLTTTEAGGTASFTVVLNSKPTASVVIGVSSSNTGEGTVSTSNLTFTTANWNAPQTITVTGVDDSVDDGDVSYSIVTAAASSSDSLYNGVNASDVSATNSDDDAAGITVTPTSGLSTTEAGGTASFTVVLNSQPTANVSIGVSSSNTSEGTVSSSSLVFTAANWNVAQTITATGVDDYVDDGNIAYSIVTAAATSADSNYSGRNAADVSVSNTDDDTAGINVTPTSGLSTTEAGGTATFTVVLDSQPTAFVSIGLSSSSSGEGSASPSSLIFTAANWSVAQTVTVSGVDDFVDDGDVAYSIVTAAATSADANYSGRNAADVFVTNLDDDTAGITVSPTSGLTTTEAEGSASFTVALNSQPTANVTIGLSSDDSSEGTSSVSGVTFTAVNWNSPQTITVTGVNDYVDDGDIAYSIITSAASSADSNYSGRNALDVSLTNTDNDTAGVTVFPTSGLVTSEAGGTDTFSVVLNSQPIADVQIALNSNDTGEGSVSASQLTFNTSNWNVPHVVTVSGVDDFADDGDVSYSVVTSAASSSDNIYNGMAVDDVSITNADDDDAGFTFTPTTGLTTTEAGGTATFTVALSSQPASDVSLSLSSSDASEGTVSPVSVTFTAGDWNVPQTVTITGVDDFANDGNVSFSIVTAPASSSDPLYSGLDPADLSVVNIDNDTPGITVSPSSGLITTEAGGTCSFSIRLNTQPTGDVAIDLLSSNLSEGTISAATLTFTSANWDSPQTVTITGVDDDVDDGDVVYTVITSAATSADNDYNGMPVDDVSATNVDNDTAGVSITPTTGLVTTEAGATDSFSVVLNSRPVGDVTFAIGSSNTAEGSVSASSLTFTAANWNVAQIVTVTGMDDAIDDGNVAYSLVTGTISSSDAGYNGIDPDDVAASNIDDDDAGIAVTPTSGLTTSEAGSQSSFTVLLTSEPTADVTIGVSSSNTGEGIVSVTSLLFTSVNWSTPHLVIVTGVDDYVDDGNVAYAVLTAGAASSDSKYAGMNAADASVINTDDDTAGISVSPTSGLVTTEAGGSASFTIVLDSQPTANVTVPLSSSDPGEGVSSASSVTFTPATWNTPQTITVTGADDFIDDGNVAYDIITAATSSADTEYSGLDAANVVITNVDDDAAGITVSPTSGLVTSESGATAQFTIMLTSQPTADVIVPLASNDSAEGTIAVSDVTVTVANWNLPQTVTITGVDDAVDDGDVAYGIVTGAATSTDPNYAGMNPANVSVTNADDDTAAIVVTPTSGLITSEARATADFSIVLASEPTGNVTIGLASSNTAEGVVSPSSVTFTPADWNTPQVVTITGVDDDVADGDVSYSIITAGASSADSNYSGRNAADVSVINTDDDTAGIDVTPTSGLVTSETGATAMFHIALTSRPLANVVIGLSSSDTTEGVLSASSVTFTPANWNLPHAVTITGVDDLIHDGDVAFSIVTAAASSSDPSYSGINPSDVGVTNTDDDIAGITITPTSGLSTTEAGGTASFTVVLISQPSTNVSVALASSDSTEGAASLSSVVFTSANWNVPRTVIVTGQDDDSADGDQSYSIITSATSTDSNYAAVDPADVTLTNLDDDVAGVTVSPTSGLTTTEAGGTASFTVVLDSKPTADVSIGLLSSDAAEGAVLTTQLTFTSADWYRPQTVTVTGVDDAVSDGDASFSIITAAAASADPSYNGRASSDVSVTNSDDDVAKVHVSPVAGLITSEGGGSATFSIVLTSQPIASVTVPLSSSDLSEGVTSTSNVMFDPSNWSIPQVITISGVNDLVQDGNIAYTIITAPAVSIDPVYSGINGANVSVINTDNDFAGIHVTPISGLTTDETGTTASFSVVLDTQPSANVRIAVTSSDQSEASTATGRLIFTPANWDTPQVVTVSGVDDHAVDGDQPYSIELAVAVSADLHYDGIDAPDVTGINHDDDVAGIIVAPTTGLITRESGADAQFTVVLQSQPLADVTIAVGSSNTGEGIVPVSSLTFTPTDWDTPQQIVVSGVDDAAPDGDQAYSIVLSSAVSTDADYSGFDPSDVSLTNIDNDAIGIALIPSAGLTTHETGTSIDFQVVLTKQPGGNVTLELDSSNTAEGIVSRSNLTFTPVNWETPRDISVSGVNDLVDDGDVTYQLVVSISASDDVDYAGLAPKSVALVNMDDDTSGLVITTISSAMTSEAGGVRSFDVSLNSQPISDVVFSARSTNRREGELSLTSFTFTPLNWDVPQRMTIAGVDDAVMDGDISYRVLLRPVAGNTDPTYSTLRARAIYLSNADNDSAGLTITPAGNSITTESGGEASFDAVLTSQPTANVFFLVRSSDRGEGRPDVATLIFTPANWNVRQRLAMSGVDDQIDDGDVSYQMVVEPAPGNADQNYAALATQTLQITNRDDDVTEIIIEMPESILRTTEAGDEATFTVRLASQPIDNVVLDLRTSNASESAINPSPLVFTPANWRQARVISLRGLDDFVDDGNIRYEVVVDPSRSVDARYVALAPIRLPAVNIDDDTAGIVISHVAMRGGQQILSLQLSSEPTFDVFITSSVPGVALNFSPQDWNRPQLIALDPQPGSELLALRAASQDSSYNAITATATLARLAAPAPVPLPMAQSAVSSVHAVLTDAAPATPVQVTQDTLDSTHPQPVSTHGSLHVCAVSELPETSPPQPRSDDVPDPRMDGIADISEVIVLVGEPTSQPAPAVEAEKPTRPPALPALEFLNWLKTFIPRRPATQPASDAAPPPHPLSVSPWRSGHSVSTAVVLSLAAAEALYNALKRRHAQQRAGRNFLR